MQGWGAVAEQLNGRFRRDGADWQLAEQLVVTSFYARGNRGSPELKRYVGPGRAEPSRAEVVWAVPVPVVSPAPRAGSISGSC